MTRAIVVVPPFLKVTAGPLLGPALLVGAARRDGHEAEVVDLNAAWLHEQLDDAAWRPSDFVGDHDRPSAALREAQRAWVAAWGVGLVDETALSLECTHEQVHDAAMRLAGGPIGAWMTDRLRGPAPDVVGVSVMYSGQVIAALAVAILARRLWPRTLVVFGGAHITALQRSIADDAAFGRFVDYFVIGYAERTWVQILDAVEAGRALPRTAVIAGVGSVVRAEDDPTVVPRFEVDASVTTLPAQASRGCAYGRCTFCTYPAIEGSYRPLDFDPVDHIIALAADHGFAVSFKDSLIVPARLEALADRIAGRVRWSACTKLHPRLDVDFLTRLARGGCATLEVGLETLLPSGQLVIEKHQALPLFLAVLDAAAEARVGLVVNYITGFPGADPSEEVAWLERVRHEIARRPKLLAKVEHNTFQLERMSPVGRMPGAYGLDVTQSWPWSTVLAWTPRTRREQIAG